MKGQDKYLAAIFLMLLAIVLVSPTVLADSGAQADTTPPRAETYGIGWGTLMLINAGIAQGKNRKGLNWFLISLLLGPIATFLLVVFFPKLPVTTP